MDHKHAIETLARLGQWPDALERLEALEEALGFSLWSLEMRVYLLGEDGGLEAQKEFSKSILNSQSDEVLKCFVHYVSLRCEPRMSWWKYDEHIDSLCDRFIRRSPDIAEFLENLLNPLRFSSKKDPSQTLAIFSA